MLALVTCASARDLDTDLPLLQRELPDAAVVAWDDHSVDWSSFAVVVIRSAWDYHFRRADFLAWASHVSEVAALWNPLAVIEWNTDKRYLLEMERQGIPIVPSTFVARADDLTTLSLDGDLVVKPAVGAGSNGVFRTRGDGDAAVAHVHSLLEAGHTAMVQPYLRAIESVGETGLVYLGGAFSHAFGKGAILAEEVEFEGGLMAVETSWPHTPSPSERELGDRTIALLPETAYARIDLLSGEHGPLLLEIELAEPSLFLHHDEGAAARAADVFRSLTV